MAYVDPAHVHSPKSRWVLDRVLCSTGQGGWSVAEGQWDKGQTLGIRWNGSDATLEAGNPQSHGNPTWFILPEDLHDTVREFANKISEKQRTVSCSFERPAEWDYGIWRVTMRIAQYTEIRFPLPYLPNRLFRHEDTKFMLSPVSQGAPWQGRFVDGQWTAILQTNGIEEDSNPSSLDSVRDALAAAVVRALLYSDQPL